MALVRGKDVREGEKRRAAPDDGEHESDMKGGKWEVD